MANALHEVLDSLPRRVGERGAGSFAQYALEPAQSAQLRKLADALDDLTPDDVKALTEAADALATAKNAKGAAAVRGVAEKLARLAV